MTRYEKLIRPDGTEVYAFQRLGVRTEIWPIAADDTGIWLLSGDDAWRSHPIRTDTEPHRCVEDILAAEGALKPLRLMHSTSWRAEGDCVILTYVAAINCPNIRDHWRNARPVSTLLMDATGRPAPTPPTLAPVPRYVDVLHHALRHLMFLIDTDAEARAALDWVWRGHLDAFEPALSGMYETVLGDIDGFPARPPSRLPPGRA